MSPARERHYWRAVTALRTAETLASLQAVSGPADGVPEAGKEQSWADDWTSRAKETLKKAGEWVQSGKQAAKDRARRVASSVREGIREFWKATPPGQLTDVSKKTMQSLADASNAITWASLIGSGAATVALLAVLWWLWSKKG